MATYKLVLTVKDNYGKEKEVDGGTVEIDLANLSTDEITTVTNALKLDTYATDQELADAIEKVPTLEVVKEAIRTDVPEAVELNAEEVTETIEKHVNTIKYASFEAPIEEE
jgi:hypothetical protein